MSQSEDAPAKALGGYQEDEGIAFVCQQPGEALGPADSAASHFSPEPHPLLGGSRAEAAGVGAASPQLSALRSRQPPAAALAALLIASAMLEALLAPQPKPHWSDEDDCAVATDTGVREWTTL